MLAEQRCCDLGHDAGDIRDFLDHQPSHTDRFEALERPVVEKQQYKGRRHQHRLGHETQRQCDDRSNVSFSRLPHDVSRIGNKAEQEQQRAERVLAFGDPGHALNVQRVHGEERGNDRAAPERVRGLPQKQEQERAVHGMQCRADEQVCSCVAAEQLHIEHVREPREREPVSGMHVGKRPDDSRPRQSTKHVLIP